MVKNLQYTMAERLVQIPIAKETRDKIKTKKGILSYNDFFKKILDDHNL
jgi:hypothetical protein